MHLLNTDHAEVVDAHMNAETYMKPILKLVFYKDIKKKQINVVVNIC